jgi:DNA-binding NarL/FixJ family response regulator
MSHDRSSLNHSGDVLSWSDQDAPSFFVQRSEHSPAAIEVALRERVKELNCLLGIAEAVERNGSDLPALLEQVVRSLPQAWQHSDVCRARLVLDGQEYRSPAFRQSIWKQTADIVISGEMRGTIEVYYLRRMPDCDDGPFLKEEQTLLDAVAGQVAGVLERHQNEKSLQAAIKQLQAERAALEQSNAALHGVLERTTADKKAAQEAIVTNVDKVLMPVLRALEQEVPLDQRKYVSLLKDNLEEITSPFADKLSRAFMSLTAVEIRICQMIRDGATTKEIAQARHVSPATVARQRERIRHKLGLTGTDANLATYLRTFLVERP